MSIFVKTLTGRYDKEKRLPQEYTSSANAHVVRIVLTLIGLVIVGVLVRQAFLPDGFGQYGYYRAGATTEEAHREVRNRTTDSCLECHPLMQKLHLAGIHKTVSCEICHAASADHVRGDMVIGIMPVLRGAEIRPLCLRCHQKLTRAAHPEAIKVVDLPEHLEQKKVRTEHHCDQCHHVHAPLKWVHEAREMMGLPPNKEDL